ncbi:TonB-dependent receptor [Cellulophaga sp. L1A9]|uniref:TonB-dependent receptor n=1 Tax=Cellulophaga sp. L1A9 TaxID=2686362 RepID=UPI00131D6BBB|nr:TonB-dependent receptor [Cellulophaga sp. L1A9]
MRKFYFTIVALLFSAVAFSQGTITGIIVGSDSNEPLPGANVLVKGTKNGTVTDFDGNFSINASASSGSLVVSYIGYKSKEVSFSITSGSTSLGSISLDADASALDEVIVTTYSLAVDRKTPVAVSTIKAGDIELKLGTQEFPEILKSTPGIYATKSGGGYGDGRVNIRGFSSENVAVMINGIPVNDMENGAVYWSNWAGLGDVTSAMQVQRGLGASKIAVPSIGGTINIVTKTTDVEEGGSIYASLANDGYEKYGFTYSTGLSDKGLAVTVSGSSTQGDGYVDGTEFKGISYFLNISKQINDAHKISFTGFGSTQRHGQRQNRQLIQTYQASESGIRYNSDWGYDNGQVKHIEDNFYNKPQMSLNHYWDINEKTNLSTVAYVSFGSGGGGGTAGDDTSKFSSSEYKIGNFGPVDIDRIVDENIANGANGSTSALRASFNNHNWYGVLSTLKVDLTDDLVFLGGVDLRSYKGKHYREVTDLLGGQYLYDDSNVNNPDAGLQVGDKLSYNNDGLVGWYGLFTQLEYDVTEDINTYLSLSGSNTGYKRVDYFQYLESDNLRETDWYNFFGYSVKGGGNYRIDGNHNVFINAGYFEKAPDFDAVFPNFNNEDIFSDAANEKVISFELGYGYRSEKLSANVNLYRTSWKDRSESVSYTEPDGTFNSANVLGVNAVHQGLEIDFNYRVTDKLTITAMSSIGDWKWDNNVTGVQIFDEDQTLVDTVDLYIEGLHVGDAAQTTLAVGTNYKLTDKTTFTVDYNYYADLYASFDPSDRGEVAPEAWELPAYGLFDTAISHNFEFGGFDARLTGRMNNVLNTEYVSEGNDGDGSVANTALVYYGFGRTFSLGLKLNF